MRLVKLDTGFNIEVEFPVAPFRKRLLAFVIDLIVLSIYTRIMYALLGAQALSRWNWVGALVSLPIIFYHLACEMSFNGRSIGKLAMNIRVITTEGGQPTFGQYLIRWAFRLVDFPLIVPASVIMGSLPWWTLPLTFSGLACVIFTPKRQRIGDLLAGTMMIDLKSRTSWQDTVFTQLDNNYQPSYPQVMKLSDRDVNTLKSIIIASRKRKDYDLSFRIAERIKSKLEIKSTEEPIDFLETLLKDYNYYSTN